MAVTSGIVIGQELCKALEIDIENVYSIDLSVKADDAVRVIIDKYVTKEQMGKVIKVLEKEEFKLVPKEKGD